MVCCIQVDHAVIRLRVEAEGSEFYPFKNATEAVSVLNMFQINLSEVQAKHVATSQKWGKRFDPLENCFICG